MQCAAILDWDLLIRFSFSTTVDDPAVDRLNFALLLFHAVISTLATYLTSTTPAGPPLNHQPRQLSGKEEKSTIAAADAPNVCLLATASPLDCLFFNWCSPLVRTGARLAQLSADDLPYLIAALRSHVLFEGIKAAVYGSSGRLQRPDRITLFWSIMRVNRIAFIVQFVLAIVTAVL